MGIQSGSNHVVEHVSSISVTVACELCAVERSFFHALEEEGIFVERARVDDLSAAEFAVFCKAARLFNDLGVNPAGIALVLQLLRERG